MYFNSHKWYFGHSPTSEDKTHDVWRMGPSPSSKGKKGTRTYTEKFLRKDKSVVQWCRSFITDRPQSVLYFPCHLRLRQIHSLKRCGSCMGINKCWSHKKVQNKNTKHWYSNCSLPMSASPDFSEEVDTTLWAENAKFWE